MRGFFILFLAMWAVPALAAINNVEVTASVTGATPLEAQQNAIEYAKKRAFFLTLSKFEPEKALKIAESLTDEQINAHIRGYELKQDRFYEEENRYLAQYVVSVSEPMVQQMLTGAPQPPGDVNPMLVLPVLRDGDQILLWEGDNIWRSVWNSASLQIGEGILVSPYGDPTDKFTVDASNVLTYNFNELSQMAQRYGAGEVVVAVATYVRDKDPMGVNVVMRRLGPGLNRAKSIYFETDNRHETPESVLPEAATIVANQLKEIARTYKGDQLRRIAEATKTKGISQFYRLQDWVALKDRLKSLPRVIDFEMESIDIQNAKFTLYHDTTDEMMREIMSANGLYVTQQGDRWNIALP